MPMPKKRELQAYLKTIFGADARLVASKVIGKESSKGEHKQYGYGTPIKVTFWAQARKQSAVLETMKPGPFGHEHMADRAQAMLWDYDSYGRLPRHVKSLDVGAFDSQGRPFSVAAGREFFVLNEWTDGTSYHQDLLRLMKGGALRRLDRDRVRALAAYLAEIHAVKRNDPDLYKRRLRELIGHGECIMGLTDSYPPKFEFIGDELLRAIEDSCNRWRWRLRERSHRLSQVHGDFHPYNVLFKTGSDFAVLDRSRGEWGEPADDLTAMSMNYLLNSLIRWGKLKGPFEVLFQMFWDTYLDRSRDKDVTIAAAPFFAFRGLVVASPLWYPNLDVDVRRKIFRFLENVLDLPRFDPGRVNDYLA